MMPEYKLNYKDIVGDSTTEFEKKIVMSSRYGMNKSILLVTSKETLDSNYKVFVDNKCVYFGKNIEEACQVYNSFTKDD